MPVESATDRLAFLNPDEFGVEASYDPALGAAVTIEGILDDPTLPVVAGERATTVDSAPTFLCRTADLPAGAEGGAGDTLTIGAVDYDVVAVEPDGQGMTLLRLAP